MHFPLNRLAGGAAAFALCISSTMAGAATVTTPVQPINPIIALSILGTQASAQAVCSQAAAAAGAAGAAIAAQGQARCVLPATDVPPAVAEGAPPPVPLAPPPPPAANFGINWLLLALGSFALLAGLSTLFDDDDDEEPAPISPA